MRVKSKALFSVTKAERNAHQQTYTIRNVKRNSLGGKKMLSGGNVDLHEKLRAPEI